MSERSDGPTEKALQEFLSEAQEIVEQFNRDLLALDEQRAAGAFDPEVINDAFRAVHSLKGLSGLFGVGVSVRNALYDRGLFQVQRLKGPVVSIGNLCVGGTGKTPLVVWLCDILTRPVDATSAEGRPRSEPP